MILAGVGSIVGHELAKLALDNAPILRQAVGNTAVSIAKNTFDMVLNNNPHFSDFLDSFGIHKFNQSQHTHRTFTNRGKRRHITHTH